MFDSNQGNAAMQNAQMQNHAFAGKGISSCAPVERESESALQRIVHQFDMLNNCSQRISAAADRLVGSRPHDVAGNTASAAPASFSSKLHILADALSRLNSDMAENADRLESLILSQFGGN